MRRRYAIIAGVSVLVIFSLFFIRTDKLANEINENSNLGIQLLKRIDDEDIVSYCNLELAKNYNVFYICDDFENDSIPRLDKYNNTKNTLFYSIGYPDRAFSIKKITQINTNEIGRDIFGLTIGEEYGLDSIKDIFDMYGYEYKGESMLGTVNHLSFQNRYIEIEIHTRYDVLVKIIVVMTPTNLTRIE